VRLDYVLTGARGHGLGMLLSERDAEQDPRAPEELVRLERVQDHLSTVCACVCERVCGARRQAGENSVEGYLF